MANNVLDLQFIKKQKEKRWKRDLIRTPLIRLDDTQDLAASCGALVTREKFLQGAQVNPSASLWS